MQALYPTPMDFNKSRRVTGSLLPPLTLYALRSVCIFSILSSVHFQRGWQGEFVSQSRTALVGDHLLYLRDFHVWMRGDIVRTNLMPVTHRAERLRPLTAFCVACQWAFVFGFRVDLRTSELLPGRPLVFEFPAFNEERNIRTDQEWEANYRGFSSNYLNSTLYND